MTSSGNTTHNRPHEGLAIATPLKIHTPSSRIHDGLPDIDYPFHDREVPITAFGRICMHRKKSTSPPCSRVSMSA